MILIQMRERGPTPRHMAKHMRRILKECWAELMVYWHTHMLPKHFTARGAREYGYTPRQGERGAQGSKGFRRSYTGRKLRVKGHTRPLVYSGNTELLTRQRTVTSTSKGGRIRLSVPAYIKYKLRHSKINMAEELTKVSRGEEQELARVFERILQQKLNGISDVSVRQVA